MRYTKATYYDYVEGEPAQGDALDATRLNYDADTLAALANRSTTSASFSSGTSSNYNLAVNTFTTIPTGSEVPLSVIFTPTVANTANCTITPSWGSTAYSIRNLLTKNNLIGGEIQSSTPITLVFDGTYFWGAFGVPPMAQLTALPSSGTALQDNANYIVSSAVGTHAFVWPSSKFHVHLNFTTSASPNITFPAGTKYAGSALTFEASTEYELDIENGIVAWVEVVSA